MLSQQTSDQGEGRTGDETEHSTAADPSTEEDRPAVAGEGRARQQGAGDEPDDETWEADELPQRGGTGRVDKAGRPRTPLFAARHSERAATMTRPRRCTSGPWPPTPPTPTPSATTRTSSPASAAATTTPTRRTTRPSPPP